MRGDVYLNHFLGFVVEAPAILGTIFAVGRVGRRSCSAVLLLEGEQGAIRIGWAPHGELAAACPEDKDALWQGQHVGMSAVGV